jgi:hypothetical protein
LAFTDLTTGSLPTSAPEQAGLVRAAAPGVRIEVVWPRRPTAVTKAVKGLRTNRCSWAEIGTRITRQAASNAEKQRQRIEQGRREVSA